MLCRIKGFENCICVTKSHNEIKREFVLKNKILITVGYMCVRLTLSFRSFLLKKVPLQSVQSQKGDPSGR